MIKASGRTSKYSSVIVTYRIEDRERFDSKPESELDKFFGKRSLSDDCEQIFEQRRQRNNHLF